MKAPKILTSEKFAEIFTNKKLRNDVAFANVCYESNGDFKYYKASTWPIEYIVTAKQVVKAFTEVNRDKTEIYATNKHKLLFEGAGSDLISDRNGDVENCRIRTKFRNSKGNLFYVEFCPRYDSAKLICVYAINLDKQKELNDDVEKQREFYNYGNLERNDNLGAYSLENILQLVNKTFDCKFTEIIVDSYTIYIDDKPFFCESPE